MVLMGVMKGEGGSRGEWEVRLQRYGLCVYLSVFLFGIFVQIFQKGIEIVWIYLGYCINRIFRFIYDG